MASNFQFLFHGPKTFVSRTFVDDSVPYNIAN
jgi:hypothetical protein